MLWNFRCQYLLSSSRLRHIEEAMQMPKERENQTNPTDNKAMSRDVTEQKQAWQYARSFIEATLDPMVVISVEGKITDVNEATVKVSGFIR